MAGINRWAGGYGDMSGDAMAVPMCGSCKYFKHIKGDSSPFKCTADSNCTAANDLMHGKHATKCDSFAVADSSNKSSAKASGGGRGKPIWLRILCCPFNFLVCFGGGKPNW